MEKLFNGSFFLIIVSLIITSCTDAEGNFTTGAIAIIITAGFFVVVLFYFLFRPQSKRKGDKNRRP